MTNDIIQKAYTVNGSRGPIRWIKIAPKIEPNATAEWYELDPPVEGAFTSVKQLYERLNERCPAGKFVCGYSCEAQPS